MPRKINIPRIKQQLKTAAKTTAVLAVAAGCGFGSYKVINNHLDKKTFQTIPKTTAEYRFDNFDLDKVSELNKSAKIHEIYFYEKERLVKLNLDVATLQQTLNIVPKIQRNNIAKIIQNRINTIKAEIEKNPALKKKIGNRIGKDITYEKYLLSLPMEKISEIFTKKELELIRNELNQIPKEKLLEISSKINKNFEGAVSGGFVVSIIIGSLLFEITKKKEQESFNFH